MKAELYPWHQLTQLSSVQQRITRPQTISAMTMFVNTVPRETKELKSFTIHKKPLIHIRVAHEYILAFTTIIGIRCMLSMSMKCLLSIPKLKSVTFGVNMRLVRHLIIAVCLRTLIKFIRSTQVLQSSVPGIMSHGVTLFLAFFKTMETYLSPIPSPAIP